MGAPILTTPVDFNTFQPVWFSRNRFNEVFMSNGIDAPIVWPGSLAQDAYLAGIDAPATDPTFTSPASPAGNAIAGDYSLFMRFLDWRDGRMLWSNPSTVTTETAAALDSFTYANIPTSSQTRVKFFELWRTTGNQAESFYLDARLIFSGSVISSETDGGSVKLTLENGIKGMAVGQTITVTGHSVGGYNTAHVVTAVNTSDNTVTTDQTYTSDGTGGTFSTTSFNSTASDTTLYTREHMNRFTSHRLSYLNRHTVPPNYRKMSFDFGDRRLWVGSVKYTVGTVDTTDGDRTISGTGTAWTEQMVGRFVHLDTESEPLEVIAYNSATSLDVAPAPENTDTGLSYAILPDAYARRSVDISERDLGESVPEYNRVIVQENIRDSDDIDWGFGWGDNAYVGGLHTIYRLTFRQQTFLDARPTLVARRGMFNERCWDQHEGTCFLMDDEGPWAFAQEQVIPIDKAIHNYWRDGTINVTKSKWFTVDIDPAHEVVYFRVLFTGDSGTRPNRFFEYDIRNKRWSDPGQTSSDSPNLPWEIGGGCRVHISGQQRLVLGADNDQIYLANEGTRDGTSASGTVRGTVSSAASTTLVDSSATFPTDVVGAPVWIIRGTGAGQTRRISSRDSDTELTISAAWTTTPDTTSTYLIGGIQAVFKSGLFRFVEGTQADIRRDIQAAFEPTDNAAEFFLELFSDHRTAPVTFSTASDHRTGVTIARSAIQAIANMLRTQHPITGVDADAEEPGMKTIPVSGRLNTSRGNPTRWMGFKLTVYQSSEQISFYGIEVGGVEEGE